MTEFGSTVTTTLVWSNGSPSTGHSLLSYVDSIMILLSSSKHGQHRSVLMFLTQLVRRAYSEVRLSLIKANIIPQMFSSLCTLPRSLINRMELYTFLPTILTYSLQMISPSGFRVLNLREPHEQQTVHETMLSQFIIPFEECIRHLCANRHAIGEGYNSSPFMFILDHLIKICPYHQPTMDFVLSLPVCLTFTCPLTFNVRDFLASQSVSTISAPTEKQS